MFFFIFDWAATCVSSDLEPNGGLCHGLANVPVPIPNGCGPAAKKQSAGHVGMHDGEHHVSGGANAREYILRVSSVRVPKSSQS